MLPKPISPHLSAPESNIVFNDTAFIYDLEASSGAHIEVVGALSSAIGLSLSAAGDVVVKDTGSLTTVATHPRGAVGGI